MRRLFPRCYWLLKMNGLNEDDIKQRLLDARRGDPIELLYLRSIAQLYRKAARRTMIAAEEMV